MIAVFGGAFNPPTLAHYEVARHVLGAKEVEHLFFIPVGDHYKKAGLVPAPHRVKMLEILTQDLPGASISKIEIEAGRALKSIETLKRLSLEYPDSELAFVMGADNLYDLINWHDYKRLVCEFKMIIINRGTLDVPAFIKDHFEFAVDHFMIVDSFSKINISSSAYRTDPTRTNFLLPEVAHYIRENKLYQHEK